MGMSAAEVRRTSYDDFNALWHGHCLANGIDVAGKATMSDDDIDDLFERTKAQREGATCPKTSPR